MRIYNLVIFLLTKSKMQVKPLYEAQKYIEHQKHLERLKKIGNKRSANSPSRNTIDEMHRIRHQSSDYQLKEKNELLNFQNNKILSKLLEISQRRQVPIYSTISSHVPKKPHSLITFNNPQRKRRQLQITETNNKLAKRLLTKQSSFDRSRVIKDISEYENVRRLMQNNRRIRLVPMMRENGGYDFSRVSTTQNSRVNKSSQILTNQISLAQTSI